MLSGRRPATVPGLAAAFVQAGAHGKAPMAGSPCSPGRGASPLLPSPFFSSACAGVWLPAREPCQPPRTLPRQTVLSSSVTSARPSPYPCHCRLSPRGTRNLISPSCLFCGLGVCHCPACSQAAFPAQGLQGAELRGRAQPWGEEALLQECFLAGLPPVQER